MKYYLTHIVYRRFGSFVLITLFVGVPLASAQVMQSGNYQIEFDSMNTAGNRSTSASYVLEDTVGEIATGQSSSTDFQIRAGYQQMNETYLALNNVQDVTLTPAIGGVTGGVANGSSTVIVTTDNLAGYELSIVASSSPAMQSNETLDTIANYTPVGVNPDFVFAVDATTSEFAFTPEGSDIAQRYLDDTASCGTGSNDTTDACWDALTTSNTLIANRTSSNHPDGSTTTLKFRVEVGSSAAQVAGSYTATSTITVIAL